MKAFPFLIPFLLFLLCGCGRPGITSTQASLKITGSTTVGPLVQKAAEAFEMQDSTLKISISEGGSGVGIANLIDETTDIAMSSRAMKMSEVLRFEASEQTFEEVILAYDALAVVVHPDNPIDRLTKTQISDIFTGKITNWQELGGKDAQIVTITRESSSGTYEFFKSAALDNREFAASARSQGSNGGIEQMVSQTEGAIGYIGFAFLSDRIKTIDISFEEEKFVEATMENAQQKLYPLARPLYFYYLTDKEEKVRPFVNYILSEKGQAFATEVGYVKANVLK